VADASSVTTLLDGGWRKLAFGPFRPGIEICRLVDGGADKASVALLRYEPGASVPRHLHQGLESVLVLEGSQSDERGCYRSGSLVFNPAGSEHSVWSDDGCVVLIQWERPVRIFGEESQEEAELPDATA
jgi:anti-sigma factor ChrR (cupin superfamily)